MSRWIGALMGYFLLGGSLLGAIIGFFVGGFFGKGLEKSLREGYSLHAHGSDIFFEVTFMLLGHMAKSDGRVSEEEIAQAEQLMGRMGVQGEKRSEAIGLFKYGADPDFNFKEQMARFIGAARFRADLKRNLITFLVDMAMADGELHAGEEEVLAHVAEEIGIDQISFQQMLEMLRAQHSFAGGGGTSETYLGDAYKALGVSPSASDKEIKRVYRKLISEYHPDKMIAKGVPEDMVAMATEKTQEIQAAYDLIEKSRR